MKWWWLRRAANWITLMTPLALLLARAGGARPSPHGEGMWLAPDYRWGFPVARAFTVGSVVITRHPAEWMAERPRLYAHESRHAWQWAACIGLPFLLFYLLAMLWSVIWAGDRGSHNVFEVLAGLEDGGYERRPSRFSRA